MSARRKLPPNLGTIKDFRALKRAEWQRLWAALEDLRYGCAFLPPEAYKKICGAFELLQEARKACRKSWR
jgi:hypothetical protein